MFETYYRQDTVDVDLRMHRFNLNGTFSTDFKVIDARNIGKIVLHVNGLSFHYMSEDVKECFSLKNIFPVLCETETISGEIEINLTPRRVPENAKQYQDPVSHSVLSRPVLVYDELIEDPPK